MARTVVKMFATLREAAGGSQYTIDADNVGEALDILRAELGSKMSALLDRAERDSDWLVILLNGRNVSAASMRSVKLAEGDEISLFPPVSGG